MNIMAPLTAVDPILTRTEIASLVALAARTVPPVWPLESAIAVNPLAGFEDLPFEEAVRLGARRFGARRSLPLAQWRQLLAVGKLEERCLREAAIQHLGGLNAAFELIGPDVSRLDLLMARLLHLPTEGAAAPAPLSADAAFIAKWCAAFFDQAQAVSPMPNRELGLYRATLAVLAYDTEFHKLAGATAQHLLMSVPRDPLGAIAEGLVACGIMPGDEEQKLAELVARLPGWAGHIRWRNENADPEIAAGSPAGMADLIALWLLLERAGATSLVQSRSVQSDASNDLAQHFGLADTTAEALGKRGAARFGIAQVSEHPVRAKLPWQAQCEDPDRGDLHSCPVMQVAGPRQFSRPMVERVDPGGSRNGAVITCRSFAAGCKARFLSIDFLTELAPKPAMEFKPAFPVGAPENLGDELFHGFQRMGCQDGADHLFLADDAPAQRGRQP